MEGLFRPRMKILWIVLMIVLTGTGCGKREEVQVKELRKSVYQKVGYETVTVGKGDIEPVIFLNLEPDVVETIDYTVDEEELELDEILVSVGDKVRKGQTLVTFKAEEIKKSIDKHQDEVEKKQLLLDHYTRLADVEIKKNYSVEIAKLMDDVNLAKLALEEENERLSHCSIIAQKDGTISYISKVLMDGYVAPSVSMVTQVCGQGTYICETEDDYPFKIGDIFTASNETTECEMQITDMIDTETGGRKIVFEPLAGFIDSSDQETYIIMIRKASLKDVVYVKNIAVQEKDGKKFVYLVSKEGFLDAAYVTTGEEVENLVEIKSGLSGGEEVALR